MFIDAVLPLSDARRAQEMSAAGHTCGKNVLKPIERKADVYTGETETMNSVLFQPFRLHDPIDERHRLALDTGWPRLYYSYMNDSIGFALMHAGRRVEARLEEALARVKLSGAKHAALSFLVIQDQPISLSELAEKLTCVRSNITQLMDRLEADGLVKRIDDPSDRRAVRAEVTRLGRDRHAAGTKVINVVLQAVTKELAAVDPKVLKRALDAVQ